MKLAYKSNINTASTSETVNNKNQSLSKNTLFGLIFGSLGIIICISVLIIIGICIILKHKSLKLANEIKNDNITGESIKSISNDNTINTAGMDHGLPSETEGMSSMTSIISNDIVLPSPQTRQ